MLFYLFIIFQIVYSISCDITCYDTGENTNDFDYIVTPDHFPENLSNSSLEADSNQCYIFVQWTRNPDSTNITLTADISMKAEPFPHELAVAIGYDTETSSTPRWIKALIYQCSTDQCNSLSQLKLLLQALTVNDSLGDLIDLLKPVKPFKGEWCYRGSNATSVKCNTTIPVSSCTQCALIGTMDQAGMELCATCSDEEPDPSFLGYQKTFNMTDQTNSSSWEILCERENCNTPDVSESIRQKSYIDFNFSTFLHDETDA